MTLQILSAILMSLARSGMWGACSTWSRFRSGLGRLLSSVSSTTSAATSGPNSASSSVAVVSVSSMVSWSTAACSTSVSVTPPTRARISATAMGWLMYGDAPSSFRRWSRCLRAANRSAAKRPVMVSSFAMCSVM